MLSIVPGLRVAVPRDEAPLRSALAESLDTDDGPSVVRFPKGSVGPDIPAVSVEPGYDVLYDATAIGVAADERSGSPGPSTTQPDVAIVALGSFAGVGVEVGRRLADQGITVQVIDPRWVLPIGQDVVTACSRARAVVTLEDGLRSQGVGSALRDAMARHGRQRPMLLFGLPDEFLDTGSRAQLLERYGLTAQEISREVVEWVSATMTAPETEAAPASDASPHDPITQPMTGDSSS